MKRISVFLIAFLMASGTARAGGFEQPNQAASAAGVSNAVVASISDASALMYNPAAIAWQQGVSVMVTAGLNYRDSSMFNTAINAPNDGTEPFTGGIYASWTPAGGNFSGGIGFAPLYTVNNDWSTAFPTTAGITKLTVDHATMDGVYAVNSDLAIGLGADWYVARATMSQGTNVFKGNDFASFGGHASLMWKPMPAWSVGAMYRSGAKVDISGGTNSTLAFKLPGQLTVGISHDFADVWRFETDARWTRWSALKSMHVTTGAVVTQANTLDLRDTLTLMAGLTWTWTENAQMRMGYAFDQGANRSTAFNPVIADQDGHRISLGVGGDMFNIHADLAYQYVFYSKSTVTGPYAATYRDRRQSVMLSISKTFK